MVEQLQFGRGIEYFELDFIVTIAKAPDSINSNYRWL